MSAPVDAPAAIRRAPRYGPGIVMLLLAGCGGGDGLPDPGPSPPELPAPELRMRAAPGAFVNFENHPTQPLAISPDGSMLAAVNLPDARLELFDLTGAVPVPLGAARCRVDRIGSGIGAFRDGGEA